MDLRANTAVDVLIGPFVDKTDGDTTEDGLTISQADVKLSKNGQALTQKSDVTACAFDDDGYYNCELDATDTNTEGNLVLIVHEAGALSVRHEYNVLSEAAWDSLYVAKDSGFMDVNIKAVSEDTTAADNLELACDNYSETRGLTGTAVPAVAADGVGGLPISDAGGLDLDSKLANTNEITVARMGALTDWINGGRLDLLLDAIPTTAMRGTDSAALAATALTDVTWTDAAAQALIDWINGGRLDLLLDAIPTTAMRGTDSANTTVPDAAGTTNTLIGANGANLTAINLPNQTMNIVGDITGNLSGSVGSVTTKTGYELSATGVDAILDEVVENSITFREALSLFLSALTGKSSGGGTATLVFRDTADTKNRLSVTVDANGNRTAVGTRDGS